eukprot:CAMPEP_0176068584 /NCGR_PEP_ID=MMETSP0120_2-20121206/34237_1 /TAXON_ID=160619 /ORGANISM="Kryptoperidinium foliaceum, Strain CCMP 1326" /LENGTH=492 /DNA_ID=CAMNT_0017402207 /DNA_START=1 /DNA_END=1477 /DNA_ORIENTATION=-
MGNHVATGHAVNCFQDGAEYLGCTHQSLKFSSTAKAVMSLHGIESWNAKAMVQETLRKQAEIAQRSPLRNIKVEDGLQKMNELLKEGFGPLGLGGPSGGFHPNLCACSAMSGVRMTRDHFVYVCWEMLNSVKDYKGYPITARAKDKEILYEVFDSMDIDRSGVLSTGEWAGGVSVFFYGNTETCVKAVFGILDQDRSNSLTKTELREYLKPFIKAMIPEAAASLQPMLLKRATDCIFEDMDKDNSNTISSTEMLRWSQDGKNIIDALAELIDREVYKLWMENKREKERREYNSFGAMNTLGGSPTGMSANQGQQFAANGPMGSNMGSPMGGQQFGGTQFGGQQDPFAGQSGFPLQGGGSWNGAMQSGGWGNPGGFGGSPGGQQQSGWNSGSPGGQQPGAFSTGYSGSSPSVTARGSDNHFASTASHWNNVPPPPPPPAKARRGRRTQSAAQVAPASGQQQAAEHLSSHRRRTRAATAPGTTSAGTGAADGGE